MHQDCNSSLENISVDLYRYIPRGLSHMFYTAAHQPLLPDSGARRRPLERHILCILLHS